MDRRCRGMQDYLSCTGIGSNQKGRHEEGDQMEEGEVKRLVLQLPGLR